MRDAFASELTKIAAEDERVVFLSGDIGNRLFDDFKSRFPKRFFNCGVAEANMMSMAAGMALSGLRPVAYTITPFITTRCLEQIRVDVCYHNVPVTIVGVGAGLSYASLNATHHSCEDIAFLRALPNMTIVCPADPVEVRGAMRAGTKQDGPLYLRLGKKGEPVIHTTPPIFEIGKGIVIRPGTEACLLSAGTITPVALEAAEMLERRGVSTQVVSFHTVKPLDERMLSDVFSRFSVVATIEEHSIIGGLGGAVAEWLSDQPPQKARLQRVGTTDAFMYEAGEQDHAREFFGLTASAMAQRVTLALENALTSGAR
jgi:transketolase